MVCLTVGKRKVFRILAYNPQRRVWTIRDKAYADSDAAERAEALEHKGLRVRVIPGTEKVTTIKPPVNCETRRWREAASARMSDLADAAKHYKSPG